MHHKLDMGIKQCRKEVDMKLFIYNLEYFTKEVKKIIGLNLLSNIISLISTGLILFVLSIVLVGLAISNGLVEKLKEEAEISAYFNENVNGNMIDAIISEIGHIEGVSNVNYVTKEESYDRMKEVLGEEAMVLMLFNENPFEAYLEVIIHLEDHNLVLEDVKNVSGISYVRDNQEMLDKIQGITNGISIISALVLVAVGATTLVILSHIIRQGIYNNKDQIDTLCLLGAPNSFIGFPFVIVGILLTLGGGILATILINVLLNSGYNQIGNAISFIPLPSKNILATNISYFILGISVLLGLVGSLFGLSSISSGEHNT